MAGKPGGGPGFVLESKRNKPGPGPNNGNPRVPFPPGWFSLPETRVVPNPWLMHNPRNGETPALPREMGPMVREFPGQVTGPTAPLAGFLTAGPIRIKQPVASRAPSQRPEEFRSPGIWEVTKSPRPAWLADGCLCIRVGPSHPERQRRWKITSSTSARMWEMLEA